MGWPDSRAVCKSPAEILLWQQAWVDANQAVAPWLVHAWAAAVVTSAAAACRVQMYSLAHGEEPFALFPAENLVQHRLRVQQVAERRRIVLHPERPLGPHRLSGNPRMGVNNSAKRQIPSADPVADYD